MCAYYVHVPCRHILFLVVIFVLHDGPSLRNSSIILHPPHAEKKDKKNSTMISCMECLNLHVLLVPCTNFFHELLLHVYVHTTTVVHYANFSFAQNVSKKAPNLDPTQICHMYSTSSREWLFKPKSIFTTSQKWCIFLFLPQAALFGFRKYFFCFFFLFWRGLKIFFF